MYESFYGLTRAPFAVTPDPAMLFMSKVHREALATIIYGVETRKGFIVCTGEVGTGKSTIVRAFFDQVDPEAVKLIYIFTPQVTPFEMARFICRELGLDEPDSVFAAVPLLQLKLLEEFEAGRTVVLMIDEAQLLPAETLEFLRLLSNFETDTEKLIQIVLVGQPEVDAMLARRDMRQVNQRVALRARLGPFSVEESYDYIEHRLRVSGAAAGLTQVMSPSAGWLIAEAAGGIPRVINILADNALIAGFGMAQRPLGSRLAGATIREFLGKSEAPPPAPRSERFAAGWRAARRLRAALARGKAEPDEWTSAAPAAAASAPSPGEARDRDAVSAVTAGTMTGPGVHPGPPVPPGMTRTKAPLAPFATTPPLPPRRIVVDAVAPAVTGAEPIPVAAPEDADPAALNESAAAPERWGQAVSAAGVRVIEPEPAPPAEASEAAVLNERTGDVWAAGRAIPDWPRKTANERPARSVAVHEAVLPEPAPSPLPRRNATAIAVGTETPGSVRWPALSRVRSGLQLPPPEPRRRVR